MADTIPSYTSGVKNSSSPNLFDLHKAKELLVKYWYWLVISLTLSVSVTYLLLRYEVPVYRASTTILLKDAGDNAFSRMDLTEGFGLSPEMRSIENQTFIIRSQKMVKRAIERLDFLVSYHVVGNVKTTELYNNAPFEVFMDTAHVQLVDVDFVVIPIDEEFFYLKIEHKGGWRYRYDMQNYQGAVESMDVTTKHRYGQPLNTNNYSFYVSRRANTRFEGGMNYSFRFKTIASLVAEHRSALSVSPYSEGSSIVMINVVGRQTEKMKAFLRELTHVIMEYNLDKKNEIANRSLSFINTQLKSVADSLQRVQSQLATFRKAHPFSGSSDLSQTISSDFFSRDKEIRLLMLRHDYLLHLKGNLTKRSVLEDYFILAVEKDGAGDPLTSQLVTQLMALSDERAQYGEGFSSQNPHIRLLDQKMEQVRQNLDVLLSQAIDRISVRIREFNVLQKELDRHISKLPDLEKDYVDIERRYKLNDAIYTFLLQKQSENQIAKASNTSDNEVLEEPSVVAMVSPDKRRHYTRGLMLGLLIPGLIIVLREFLNTKIRNLDELKGLMTNVSVVGAIPINPEPQHDVIYRYPASLTSEAFRRLRVKLKFIMSGYGKKVILVSSTNVGEGKTFCSFNLASVFAVSGKKTILLGFDLRKPRLDFLCQPQVSVGLSHYLAHQAEINEIVVPMKQSNLYFIGAGVVPPNPAELISQPRTSALFEYLRANYDVVVVDTAPIGVVADARILVDYADAFVYVTRVGVTEKEHLKQTLDNLLSENIQSMGLVLNGIDANDRSYGYYGNAYRKGGD